MTGLVSRIGRAERSCPLESYEQKCLAEWLDHFGILWLHPPNEAKRSPRLGKMMKRLGLKAGAPDVIIFTPPPGSQPIRHYAGVAVELKRQKGSVVTQQQRAWLLALGKVGWATRVCYGAKEAIDWLTSLGYGRET